MESNKASMTAIVSAYGRAYHSLYDNPKIFDDYLARQMLTDDEFSNISKHMAEGIQFFNPDQAHLYFERESALKWVIQTQIAPTPLARSRYAEDILENAIKFGVKQYVILGAGFDTYAFRNPAALEHIKIFEVDHPATQELKLSRIKNLGWEINSSIKYITNDFSKDSFATTLLKSEYNQNERSFFSWLGVTYYLTRDEIFKTLKSIGDISLKGSAIVFDYPDSDIFNSSKTSKRVQSMVRMAQMTGEPMKTGYEYSVLESDLEKAGFKISEHLTPSDIEEKYFKGRSDNYHAFGNINYVLAVVQD